MQQLKVALKKKGAHTLERNEHGVWTLDGTVIDQERAIVEMADAVNDLGYWCQVAKDVLDEEDYQLVQTSYEYDPEND
ncbi:hypothetical protein OMP38_14615 [Cohnella ginsengisoli]|uniref:Uncharacterized protein n=1 Tax=Cohnella ginsengisoli TaxID=425004 RepID=A0A9X4KH94_9BACL|nr:hypothetical protein [Cohnella ginsengisoli]MDG0791950.1 hypothetical protein [Cohnella ginsengisoli]